MRQGLLPLAAGNVLAAVFALLALEMSAICFPTMLDRGSSLGEAGRASMAALTRNPVVMLAWGVIVALLLAAGIALSLPGHATWHLWRHLVAWCPAFGPIGFNRAKVTRAG